MEEIGRRQWNIVLMLIELCLDMHIVQSGVKRTRLLDVASKYAWTLYHDLRVTGRGVTLPSTILARRRPLEPTAPNFFECLDTVQVFTAQVYEALHPSAPGVPAICWDAWSPHQNRHQSDGLRG